MKNLAENPASAYMLNTRRSNYDAQLKHWKKEAVSYNNYQQYATLFDRTIPWQQKQNIKTKGINESKSLSYY